MDAKEQQFLPSLFRGLYKTESVPVSWDEVYRIITEDDLVRQQTEMYRRVRNDEVKRYLPCITPAVQMNGTGKTAKDIVGLTGYTMCDLDHVPQERVEEVRRMICSDPHTSMCNVTVSGQGFHIIARWNSKDFRDSKDPKDSKVISAYADAFLLVNSYYADLVGHDYDDQCMNQNRTFSLSHDPEAFINKDAECFLLSTNFTNFTNYGASELGSGLRDDNKPQGDVACDGENSCNSRNSLTEKWVKVEKDRIEAAVEYVEKSGVRYVEHSRHTFLVNCVFHMNKLGVPRQDVERWMAQYDRPEREKRSIVRSIYENHADEFGSYDAPYEWVRELRDSKDFKVSKGFKDLKTLPSCTSPDDQYTRTREDVECQPLPDYQWPMRLQRMIDCGETKAQRDVILLSSIVVIGALMSKRLRLPYGHKSFWPNLQCFVIAPPASGKGCISWVRKLAEPRHKAMMSRWQQRMAAYRKEKAAYDIAGNRRAEMEIPTEPRMSMFLVAGNNSSTGIQENIMDAEGRALICEVEADTMSESINADYGGWSDLVRKAFEHERLAYNRRMNKEYREIDTLRLSVLLSGTPAQVRPLIPSAENGLYSRQIFYNMPAVEEWIDQFSDNDDDVDYDKLFLEWGEEWKAIQDKMEQDISMITFKLDQTQRSTFNETFARLFAHAIGTHEDHHAKSSVIRLAINVLRMMSVVALLRAIEDCTMNTSASPTLNIELVQSSVFSVQSLSLMQPAKDMPAENVKDGTCARFDLRINDADFDAVLSLAEPLYRHAMSVLQLLPSQEAERREPSPVQQLLESLPMRFTRQEILATAQKAGIKEGTVDSQLSRLVSHGMLHKKDTGLYEFASSSHARVKND